MIHLGDFPASHTAVCIPFDSFAAATGASSATSNFASSDILIYKDGGTTQRTSANGITVTTSFDSQTGLNMIVVDLSDNTDAGFYAAGHEYQVGVADITVDSQTVRFWAATFSIERANAVLAKVIAGTAKVDVTKWLTGTIPAVTVTGVPKVDVAYLLGTAWLAPGTAGTPDVNVKLWNALATVELPLVPTTAGRKLDVSAGGEAGVDWANVGSPTTAVDLSGTTIKTTQKVDVDTIKTNPVVNGGTITFPTTATLASTTNITAATGVDITKILGTAISTPATAGILDVNLKNIANAAVSTTTAQLGVNAVQISGDGTAADNLEAQFDGTGYDNGKAPATQEQVGHLAVTGAALNLSASSFTLTTGTQTAGTVANTTALDSSYHQLTDATGTLDCYYEFNVGSDGIPVSVQVGGYETSVVGSLAVFAYNWGAAGWDQVGTYPVVGATTERTFDLLTVHVGTGGNVGKVRFRFYATGLTTLNLYVDQIFVSYARYLDAAAVRAAVGLATANLDTQLDALPTNAELATSQAAADDATLAAIAALNNIDAAGVWAYATRVLTAGSNIVLAKGTGVTGFNDLSAAQVNAEADTALADYDAPTHTELTAELATADDATLAAIAGLNNLSQANIRTAVGLGTANLDTQLDALPTNAELTTALAAADDAVLAILGTPAVTIADDIAGISAGSGPTASEIADEVQTRTIARVTLVDTTTTNTDMRGTDNAALASAVAALNNLSAAQVNAEVVDALAVDTYPEPGQGAPPATASIAAKVGLLHKDLRNKKDQTATEQRLYADDALTVDQKRAVSDDTVTFVRGELTGGP